VRFADRSARGRLAAAAALILITLTGCAPPSASAIDPATTNPVTITDDLDYGGGHGTGLDVCAPSDPSTDGPLPAIIAIHGGGWSRGDKQERPWREVCGWLASEGFVVFQTNYRLAPAHPYPAAIDDLTTAVKWMREPEQVDRFGIDPARIAAFGDSAGGNLAALLGTLGSGDTSLGSRISGVVELSGPIDLTREGTALGDLSTDFQRVQLDYLGCASYDSCAAALDASPSSHIDPSDPPFFIAHSTQEFIPIEQAEELVGGLRASSVEVTYVPVPGNAHALGILDDSLRAQIVEWLNEYLGTASP